MLICQIKKRLLRVFTCYNITPVIIFCTYTQNNIIIPPLLNVSHTPQYEFRLINFLKPIKFGTSHPNFNLVVAIYATFFRSSAQLNAPFELMRNVIS